MNDKENKQIMARNIKFYMERKGVSNQQLCDALGFKYTTFLDWVKGVTYPRIGKVEAMANYFGCEKSDLIEDKTAIQDGLHEYVKKNNDALASIVIRLRNDEDFFYAIKAIYEMDKEKLSGLLTLLK